MSAIAIVSSFIVSSLGVLSNCSIIILVVLTKQLNSPNRILLLHLSIVCLSLSFVYLWILINNSIIQTPLNRFITATIPESAAITTATSSSKPSHFYYILGGLNGETTTNTPIKDSVHDSMCSVNDLLIHLLQPISLWTISCINFDRYYAICSPLHYNTLFTTKKVTIFLCSGWLIILLTIFPIYLMLMISDDRQVMTVCWFKRLDMRTDLERNFDEDYYWFEVQILLTTLLTIFLPISLIVACNIRVLTIANYQRHRIASAIYESVLSAQVAITHQKNPFPPLTGLYEAPFPLTVALFPPKPNPFELRRKSQKAAIVVFELIASVVILYCPYYLFVVFFSFYRKSQLFTTPHTKDGESPATFLNIIIFFIQFLMTCSPTINAVLYGFKNKTIQENIHNIWRKQKTKIELHYEIQARTPSTCGSRKASLTEVTTNMPHYQPQLKRQLSEFFFGTSSSLTSHLNDDVTIFHSHKIHRTPSDSLFSARRNSRDLHHEYLSPNFDPLGKIPMPTASQSSSSATSANKIGLSPSTSKHLLSNFKKLLVGSRNDLRDGNAQCETHFPQILITKHSDSLLNTQSQSTSRRESDIQQVVGEEGELAEKEPLLTTQTRSMENFIASTSKKKSSKSNNQKFSTL